MAGRSAPKPVTLSPKNRSCSAAFRASLRALGPLLPVPGTPRVPGRKDRPSPVLARRAGAGVSPPAVRSPTANVGRWIALQAAQAGDRPAVADTHRTLDYKTLEERCARLTRVLADAGVQRGDRVALLLGNR